MMQIFPYHKSTLNLHIAFLQSKKFVLSPLQICHVQQITSSELLGHCSGEEENKTNTETFTLKKIAMQLSFEASNGNENIKKKGKEKKHFINGYYISH